MVFSSFEIGIKFYKSTKIKILPEIQYKHSKESHKISSDLDSTIELFSSLECF